MTLTPNMTQMSQPPNPGVAEMQVPSTIVTETFCKSPHPTPQLKLWMIV